ncbi:hypothetical protein MUO79_05835 [Candidatus Bathyarchaeota archaeon]|nr:hypothetical protein [Candidatus Bathyarchaeota archaeon]
MAKQPRNRAGQFVKARAPRRRSYSARASYASLAKRRRNKAKIPVEVAIVGVTIPFTPPTDSSVAPIRLIQEGAWEQLAIDLRHGFTGMDGSGHIYWSALLNPFNMNSARYTKMLGWAAGISKIRKRVVKLPLERIPFIGRYIS